MQYSWRIQFWLLALLIICYNCNNDSNRLIYNSKPELNKAYKVIIMAGQSNMVGLGNISYLKNDTLPQNIIYFNHGTDTDKKILKNTFGPEVSLSQQLSKTFPKDEFILIKYAIGGSSIQDWTSNDTNEENHLNDLVAYTEKHLKGLNTEIIGFLWMQGETDATTKELSNSYETAFKDLIENIRLMFNKPHLPIIYGEVSGKSDNPEAKQEINKAQLNISKTILDCYYIKTNDLPLKSDELHFDESALLTLGERFGTVLENTIVLERNN